MKNHVKITTLESILDLFYPCYCKGCGKPGEIFCERCYNYNRCENPSFFASNYCGFEQVVACGIREGLLKKMILDYKFRSRRALAAVFSRMISDEIARMGLSNFVIVPLPTVRKHIRARGFDHIMEICRRIDAPVERLIVRQKNTVQVGKQSEERILQAKKAYRLDDGAVIDRDKTYVLVDDVWTTGASMTEAGAVLRAAGARHLVAIVLTKNDGYEFT